jgi:hypothetical protein
MARGPRERLLPAHIGVGVRNLVESVGRVLIEELAEQLDALVVDTVPA